MSIPLNNLARHTKSKGGLPTAAPDGSLFQLTGGAAGMEGVAVGGVPVWLHVPEEERGALMTSVGCVG